MAKQMRKAINFDLDTKKLKDAYCVTNRPLEYLKAYGEIKDFMKSKGFLHRQWSGYVSNKSDVGNNSHYSKHGCVETEIRYLGKCEECFVKIHGSKFQPLSA